MVMPPPLPLLEPLPLWCASPSPLPVSSIMDKLDGLRCMDNETGMVVITSLGSKPLAVVVIVGNCALAVSGRMLSVPVGIVSPPAPLVDTAKGKESVVMLLSAGIAGKMKGLFKKTRDNGKPLYYLQLAVNASFKRVGITACARAAVVGCPGIRVLLDDELSISLMGDNSSVPNT